MAKLSKAEVKEFQRLMESFRKKYLKGVKPLKVDGVLGYETRVRAESTKYYMGFGASRHAPDGKLTDYFLRCLKSPKGKFIPWKTRRAGEKRRVLQRRRAKGPSRIRRKISDWRYGGCRSITNEIIQIVREYNAAIPVTSRKRWKKFGNPNSDHYEGNRRADAVDFGTANNQRLMDHIAARLGGPRDVRDYQNFYITRSGKRFRVQIIAVTHGTGPHLHTGVGVA